jgi:hypothetical protein
MKKIFLINKKHFVHITNLVLLTLFTMFIAGCHKSTTYPVGATLDSTVIRYGDVGDNWFSTWGSDGALYAAQCDGRGWLDDDGNMREFKNNQIWRITGSPDSANIQAEMLEGYPDYSRTGITEIYGPIISPDTTTRFPLPKSKELGAWNWYGYGIVSIDGNIYQFISHCADKKGWGWFDGTQLIWSPKGDKRWLRWNGTDASDRNRWLLNEGGNQLMFFNEPDYAFSFISVAQFGQDYNENKDGYVYLYSPEGKLKSANLNMARVKKENILDRDKWEYFTQINEKGKAEWIMDDITKRGIVHQFPQGWGFYSWSPSVVWNEKLELFIMVAGGTQRPGTGERMSNWPHNESGSLMLLYSENPWGPWTQFYYNINWQVGEDNRTYLPQLTPKWISDDGKSMYIIFSDFYREPNDYYKWNMIKMNIVMKAK